MQFRIELLASRHLSVHRPMPRGAVPCSNENNEPVFSKIWTGREHPLDLLVRIDWEPSLKARISEFYDLPISGRFTLAWRWGRTPRQVRRNFRIARALHSYTRVSRSDGCTRIPDRLDPASESQLLGTAVTKGGTGAGRPSQKPSTPDESRLASAAWKRAQLLLSACARSSTTDGWLGARPRPSLGTSPRQSWDGPPGYPVHSRCRP